MRQVFRLIDMPDKVIAFDELPEDLLEGLELSDCSKLPREWREFIGSREKHINIRPERNPFTGQVQTYQPLVLKAPYAFLVDREINKDKERWGEIESYVRRNAPKDFRLKDSLVDMAKPMAKDAHSELDLEPEDVIVIPLIKVEKEPEAAVVLEIKKEIEMKANTDIKKESETADAQKGKKVVELTTAELATLRCLDCGKEFDKRSGLRMHKMNVHKQLEPVKA